MLAAKPSCDWKVRVQLGRRERGANRELFAGSGRARGCRSGWLQVCLSCALTLAHEQPRGCPRAGTGAGWEERGDGAAVSWCRVRWGTSLGGSPGQGDRALSQPRCLL